MVPAAYLDKLFTCTLHTVVPTINPVNTYEFQFENQDQKGFDILLNGTVNDIVTANKVQSVEYVDVNGVLQTAIGFKIRRRDFLNASFNINIYNISMLSIDVTVG